MVTPSDPEVSIVMPCLNEADTLAKCIRKAHAALAAAGIQGEIVVADNGSTDGSQEIACEEGARLVPAAERGYGSALMTGISAARGRFVIMGDADDSYDFGEAPRLVEKLREGYDLVQGCRLPAGGGTVASGAMPWLHRWIGNPLFTFLARWWFGAPIHDVYCGLRGFTKEFYESLDQRCTGMEFATEMIIKASLGNARIAEVPITLHPDGRKHHPPHLRTFRDGWRTLRFFLMCSPRWLFMAPGWTLIFLGLLGYALALPGVHIGRIAIDVHTLLFASLALIIGFEALIFGFVTKAFATTERILPPDPSFIALVHRVKLETGLAIGAVALIAGIGLLLGAVNLWRLAEWGNLDYSRTMRWVIPGATLTAMGFEALLGSFFLSIILLRRR